MSEFDEVFAQLESPDYPATCNECGAEGTNASLEEHVCEMVSRTTHCENCGTPTSFERTDPKTQPREGEVCEQCQAWLCPDCVHSIGEPCPPLRNESPAPRAGESEQWTLEHVATNLRGSKTLFLNGTPVAIVATDTLNDHQRALDMTAALNQHSTLVAQRERLLRLLRPVTSPTSCYCAVMGSGKCWYCEARELIAASEQERRS